MRLRRKLLGGAVFILLLALSGFSFFTKKNDAPVLKTPAVKNESAESTRIVQRSFDSKLPGKAVAQPSPQNKTGSFSPSAVAARHFPACVVIDVREETLDGGEIHRIELVRTKMKHPLIRIESRVRRNPQTGTEELLFLHEAAADHVLVELQPQKNQEDLAEAIRVIDGRILKQVPLEYAQTFIITLPEPGLDSVPQAIAALSQNPEVIKTVDADGVARKQSAPVFPNDPKFSEMWSIHNNGQTFGSTADCDIDLPEAWAMHTGSSSVIIAVLDTGIHYDHSDLQANLWRNTGEIAFNGKDDDGNGFIDDDIGWNFANRQSDNNPFDDDGHGTHVSGIIGATANNGIGIAGICWKCRILPVRVLDSTGGYNSDIAAGYDYARRMGSKIINASHGGTSDSFLQNGVNSLQNYGVLLVAAAGNEGQNNDAVPTYPASYTNSNIISVGYNDDADKLDEDSNYGVQSVDVIAPGVSILTTGVAGRYDFATGSSFATPTTAGVAGLLLAKNPTWTSAQIRSAILNNVDVRPQFAAKCVTGGRLNAYKALAAKVSLSTALDGSGLTWSTGGNAQWTGRNMFSYDGVDMAESGTVWHNQQSWIQTSVTGPGTISFRWKVSSEANYDFFRFFIDNVEQSNISGERNWALVQLPISSGSHTLLWRYSKDASDAGGDDQARLDQVVFTSTTPKITSQPASQSAFNGSTVLFSVSATSPTPLSYQWQRNGTNISGATTSRLTLANVQASNAGTYKARVSNSSASVLSSSATLTVCILSFSPSSLTLPFSGGSASFTVTETGTCGWIASTTNSWISFTSSKSGPGSKMVSFSASTNANDAARLGCIVVGNKKLLVTQKGRLAPASFLKRQFTLTITNGSGTFPKTGAYILFANQTPSVSNAFKIFPISGATSADAGTFTYSRPDATHSRLSLSSSQGASTVQFTFTSVSAGFFARSSGTNLQRGTFVTQHARPDFNRDGRNDLLLQNTNGTVVTWFMRGTNSFGSVSLRNPGRAKVCGVADFLNRGETDILLQHTNGQISVWLMSNRTNFSREVFLRNGMKATNGWNVCGLGDFNNDNKTDLLWQHTDGRVQTWLMNGTNFISSPFLRDGQPASLGWRAAGISDFNNDGQLDILWQNQSGQLSVWFLVGTNYLSSTWLIDSQGSSGWNVVAINDCNNDGRNDLILQHTDRRLSGWFLNGKTLLGKSAMLNNQPVSSVLKIVGPK